MSDECKGGMGVCGGNITLAYVTLDTLSTRNSRKKTKETEERGSDRVSPFQPSTKQGSNPQLFPATGSLPPSVVDVLGLTRLLGGRGPHPASPTSNVIQGGVARGWTPPLRRFCSKSLDPEWVGVYTVPGSLFELLNPSLLQATPPTNNS